MYEYQHQPSHPVTNNKYNTNLSSHPYYSSPTYDETPPSIMQFGRDDMDFLNAPPTAPRSSAPTMSNVPSSSPSYFSTNFPNFQEQDSITQQLNQYKELEQSINGTLANIKENTTTPHITSSFPYNNVQSNFDSYREAQPSNQRHHPLSPPASSFNSNYFDLKNPIQSPSQAEEYSKLQRDFSSLLDQHQKLLISKEEMENRLKEKISVLSKKIFSLERNSQQNFDSSDWLKEKDQYERRIKVMQRQYDAKISDLVHQFEREKGAALGILRERMRAEVGLLIPRIKESCKRHYQRISKESIDGLSFRLKNQYETLISKIRSQNHTELRLRDDEWRCRLKDQRDQIIKEANDKLNDKFGKFGGKQNNFIDNNQYYINNKNISSSSSSDPHRRLPLESISGNYFDENSFLK